MRHKSFRTISCILSIVLVVFHAGCDQNHQPELMSGDVVFVSSQASGLSEAINDVTRDNSSRDFVHMALVEIDKDDTFLIHADTDRGVSREGITSFKNRYPNTAVYRIENLDKKATNQSIRIAKSHIGKRYNFTYYNNDSALYCSQLIYIAFENDSVFSMNPMTFKNTEADSFNRFWSQYYDSLGVAIPEGVLGCNPNQMSQNAKLMFMGKL